LVFTSVIYIGTWKCTLLRLHQDVVLLIEKLASMYTSIECGAGCGKLLASGSSNRNLKEPGGKETRFTKRT
jgi:hypothetical protein